MAMQISTTSERLTYGTNIDSIVVPEHMRRRISLGIDWVDKLFGGQGAIPSMAVLLTGTPGAGKTTLSLMLSSIISARQNSVALFNTREESPFQVRMTCERMGLTNFIIGTDQLVPSKAALEEADIHPNTIKNWNKVNKDGSPKHGSIIDHAMHTIDTNPGSDLVLICDSLQTMNDGKYGPETILAASQTRVIEQLTSFAKLGYKGVHPIVIVIGQVTKDGEFAGKNTVKHAVDAHMHLYIDEDRRSDTYGRRLIEMQKNRFGCCGTKIILDMEKQGLVYAGEYSWAAAQAAA